MAMDGNALATAIKTQMGLPSVSAWLTAFGSCIVAELTGNAVITNASGTIMGTCPSSGGALITGAASGGTITGLDGSRLASAIQGAIHSAKPDIAGWTSVTGDLSNSCSNLCNHIMTGLVSFSAGQIAGNCTNSPDTGGPLATGAGSGGIVSGLDGSALAGQIHAANGYPGSVSTPLTNFCTGIVNYIMANAAASYASGNVTGNCPGGGGPLSTGAGASGVLA